MLDPQREIQALVDTFVDDLSQLAKRIAIEQIKAAFEFGAPSLPAYVPGQLSTSAGSSSAQQSLPIGGAAPTGKRGRRARQDGDVANLRGRLLSAIGDGPGQRTEDLNGVLGTETALIAPVLRKLVAEGQVRTEGARRGTRYFVATPGNAMANHGGHDEDDGGDHAGDQGMAAQSA